MATQKRKQSSRNSGSEGASENLHGAAARWVPCAEVQYDYETTAEPPGAPRPPAGPGGSAAESMAESVTRHALISEHENEVISNSQLLLCGVDTLDLGVYVKWGPHWDRLSEELEAKKTEAQDGKGVLWRLFGGIAQSTFFASGKPPQYRYHFLHPLGHFYVGIGKEPRNDSPNVYVSVLAHALWPFGIKGVAESVTFVIEALGGTVLRIKPSRVDLCADFLVPGGISEQFIRHHLVSKVRSQSGYRNGDELETFYLGAKGNPIQLRIYNKTKEIDQNGTKRWFFELWGVDEGAEAWRVEFQIRRPTLRKFGIDDLEKLEGQLAGLWQYLTADWASLRLRDDPNASRRSIHPWWHRVQQCASEFGQVDALTRVQIEPKPPRMERCVSMVTGLFISHAAAHDEEHFLIAWDHLGHAVRLNLGEDGFAKRCRLRRALWCLPLRPEEGDEHEPAPF